MSVRPPGSARRLSAGSALLAGSALPALPVLVALTFIALMTLGLFSASPALAETPWWKLTSASRPSYLSAGAARPGTDEVQEIFTTPGNFEAFTEQTNFLLGICPETKFSCEPGEKIRVEEFASEPVAGAFAVTPLTAENIQTALEKPAVYGPGGATVKEESTDKEGNPLTGGDKRFVITSAGPKAEKPVAPLEVATVEIGTAEVSVITPGKGAKPDGEIYVTAENLGNQSLSGQKSPVTISDVLPPELKAIAIEGSKPNEKYSFTSRKPLTCSLQTLSCTLDKTEAPLEALAPYDQLEMRIAVDLEGATSGEQNEVRVSGGEGFTCRAVAAGTGKYSDSGCMDETGTAGFERSASGPVAASSLQRAITVNPLPVPFGVEEYGLESEEEGGSLTTQAGAHPFQQTTTITLNQTADTSPPGSGAEEPHVNPVSLPKDLHLRWPAGLIGNPTPIAQCTDVEFFAVTEGGAANLCPPDSAVGVATVTINEPNFLNVGEVTVPLFNLVPRVGEPARFGFNVTEGNAPVTIDTAVRTGSDYGVTVSVNNVTQTAAFLSSKVTVWGVPGDSRHNRQRGWSCLLESRGFIPASSADGGIGSCNGANEQHPPPFLSMPTSCEGPLQTSVEADSWESIGSFQSFPGEFKPASLVGCNRLPFSAEIKVAPDSQRASTPTGLNVDVHVPQEEDLNGAGVSSSNVRDIKVLLPEGVKLNPAAADGLEACSEAQIGYLPSLSSPPRELQFSETLPEPLQQGLNFCPDASKVGTVKIKTPILPNPLEGAVYLAAPAPNEEEGQNPYKTLVAMYIVAKDPVSGVLIKLPGRVTLDQQSGRIEANFENSPQAAFEDAEVHFFGGERAPLATPARCGTYTTEATFTPWSGTPPIKSSSSFQITSGPNGGPCPSPLPFSPSLAAGSPNNNAGSFSALSTTITREDGNQDLNNVQLHFAPGMSGILAGIPLCPEAQANAGTCSEASRIGETTVSVGLGGDPYTVTAGKVYLTEKYQGAPFGLSIVNPADAGPFHLGKVIVRAKIEIDPLTTALTVTTGQIPHILDGIPLQIKHVNVNINRQGFTFNPTNCNPQSITGTIGSVEGASSPVSVPFQATNCANLKFAPKFAVSTAGKTSKAAGASLVVKLTYPKAPFGTYANVAKVKVSLPKQLPSRLTTLQKACTAAVFAANPAACPKESIVGQAKVITPLLPVPLAGPAYFVSHGGEAFPDLTIVLQGYGVTAVLVGSTSIKNGVTTSTFKATPDVPFSSFELNLPQGKFSALAANADLCKSALAMPTEFTAQNGVVIKQSTPISVTGCETKAQKLAKAMKACRKMKKHSKKAACEARARKEFGPVKKAKKAKKGSKKGAKKK